MPAPIYLPQDPSTLGAMMQPAMQQGTNFLWNLLSQRIASSAQDKLLQKQQAFEVAQQERKFEHEENLQDVKGTQAIAQSYAKKLGKWDTRNEGEEQVTYEWQMTPGGMQRVEVARAPRYKPGTNVTVQNVLKQPPQKQLGDLQGLYSYRKQLHRLATTWDPKFSGQVQGRLGWLRENFGIDLGLDPEKATTEVVFRQISKDLRDTLLRLRSGAQINEQEYQRLVKLVPVETMPDRTFIGRLISLTQAIDDAIEIREMTLSGVGYKAPARPKLPSMADIFPQEAKSIPQTPGVKGAGAEGGHAQDYDLEYIPGKGFR